MDTSDDFFTALFGGGGGGDIDIPAVRAETQKTTAAPVDRGSETARANRKRRRQTSLLTRDFGAPQLGIPGLTGGV